MAGFASLPLRVVAISAVLLAGIGGVALAQEKVGVKSAVNPEASGTPPGGTLRRLVIGQDVLFNERIATGKKGQTQLLFLDESSMSIGPNSDLTINQFVYDPRSGTGKLAMSATKGLLRYVGGKLSKQDEGVTLRTSTATLAVRGGAFIAYMDPNGATEVIFIYGKGLTVTGNGGSQTITRAGYHVTASGGPPSTPSPTPPGELSNFLQQLDGQPGGTGGAPVIPSDTLVASSGIGQTISGDINQSLQQSIQNGAGTPTIPSSPTSSNTFNNQLNLQAGANNAPDCVTSGACPSNIDNSGVASPPVSNNPPPPQPPIITPPPPPPPPPVTIAYAGRVKNTNNTTTGFLSTSSANDAPYPTSSPAANGVLTPSLNTFSGTIGALGSFTFPLAQCTASGGCSRSFQHTGSSSTIGAFSGTTFMSGDNTFFYASVTPDNNPTQRLLVSGGLQVSSNFYQPTGSTRIFAFDVQPDPALQSNMPFVRSQAGGNLPNATVSPFYAVAPATTAIGNAGGTAAARGLQASLAISGQGANQQSAIAMTAGTFNTLQSSGQPIFNGQMRGSSMLSATGTPVRLSSPVSSSVDGNGNSFYGGNSVSGFVLDQTAYAAGSQPGTAGAPIGAASAGAEVPMAANPTAYGFAQPAVGVPINNGVGTNRTTQTLTGNFGGLTYTTAQANPYIVTGTTSLSTDATNNRVQATLAGQAATASAGVTNVAMQYGGLTGNAGVQAFVDNNNYAAAESPTTAQQITINGVTSQPTGQLYMVSSGTAGAPTSILPSGTSYCQCQYLQWGYWGGDLITPGTAGAAPRIDRGHINTWVAGVPTPLADLNNLASQSATGSYTGHAIGSVFNNGASYVAAGGFNANYNFGTQSGTFAITNFDGHTISAAGSAPLSGGKYAFTFNNPGVQGAVNGSFYGPNAAETGGNFGFHSTVGPAYLASGIYAGKR